MNVLYCFILKKKLCINSSSTKTFQWFSIYAFVNSAFVAYLSSHHSSALSHWKASLQHYGISSAFYVLLNWISLHSFQGGLKSEPARATFIMAVCRYEYWGTLYEYDVIPKAVAKKLQFLSDGSLAFRFNVGKLLCFLRVFQAFRYGSQPVLQRGDSGVEMWWSNRVPHISVLVAYWLQYLCPDMHSFRALFGKKNQNTFLQLNG